MTTRSRATTQLRQVSDAQWDAAYAAAGSTDIYFRRGYFEASRVLEPGEPTLVQIVDEMGASGMLYGFLLRDAPGHPRVRDIVTPYGYGGPLAWGDAPPVAAFDEQFRAWSREHNVVTGFDRYHPVLATQQWTGPSTTRVELASTISWRVGGDVDLLMGMHGKHRNMVRRAQREGVEIQIRDGADIDLGSFAPIYERTMERAGAAEHYYFTEAYWQALASGIGDSLVRVDAILNGQLVACALCMASKPTLHYHLGASEAAGRTCGASTLVLYEAARWAQDNGYERVHLGGGVGGADDSLRRFKHRFDPAPEAECACFIGKTIYEEATYGQLVGAAAAANVDGYFPAYRA